MPAHPPLLPGGTLGIVGGGQLGRMTAIEARRMGYGTVVLDPDPDAPAARVADRCIGAALDDADAALALAGAVDVVTIEWENADVAALRELEGIVPVRPGAQVLEVAQHRVREKEAARRLGLPTAEFRAVSSLDELHDALSSIGAPAVLKTARGGYDGRGQAVIRTRADAESAYGVVGGGAAELILEAWVDFEAEISVICARGADGGTRVFPIAENVHAGGILDTTIVPARIPDAVAREARRIGETMAEGLDVVGLLTVELFLGRDGALRVNEIAPRPHNSGHHSLESCSVSQFEQHVRAVCGLPLEPVSLLAPAAMVNLLGEHLPRADRADRWLAAFDTAGVALHLYGKREARGGRKMGHLTVCADTPEEAVERAHRARRRLLHDE